jgi:hypothetical protein
MAQAINGKAQQRRGGTRRAGSRRAEDFVAKREKHDIDAAAQTRAMDAAARAIARAEGIVFTIYTLRGTEQQKELVKYAAKREKKSMQQIIAEMFDILEERYGAEVALDF